MDIVDKPTRRRMMSGIRGKNTKPELFIRSLLHKDGFRFRLHLKHLAGRPDIVCKKHNLVIFVHGCFWHMHPGCSDSKLPKTNKSFWKKKLRANAARDIRHIQSLNKMGWRVLVVWECTVRKKSYNAAELTRSVYRYVARGGWQHG